MLIFPHIQLPCFLCPLQMSQCLKIIAFFSLTLSFRLLLKSVNFNKFHCRGKGQAEINPRCTIHEGQSGSPFDSTHEKNIMRLTGLTVFLSLGRDSCVHLGEDEAGRGHTEASFSHF